MSILPNIVDWCLENGIELGKPKNGQYVIRCLFHSEKTPSLFIHPEKNVFKCFGCGESGGVVRFISLVTKKSEQEVLEEIKGKRPGKVNPNKRKLHPAEQLSSYQLKAMGFLKKPNWEELRRRDYFYYRRTLEYVWQCWEEFIEDERERAMSTLRIGLICNAFSDAVNEVKKREKLYGVSLLPESMDDFIDGLDLENTLWKGQKIAQ